MIQKIMLFIYAEKMTTIIQSNFDSLYRGSTTLYELSISTGFPESCLRKVYDMVHRESRPEMLEHVDRSLHRGIVSESEVALNFLFLHQLKARPGYTQYRIQLVPVKEG